MSILLSWVCGAWEMIKDVTASFKIWVLYHSLEQSSKQELCVHNMFTVNLNQIHSHLVELGLLRLISNGLYYISIKSHYSKHFNLSFFSTQNLANGGDAMELEIVVGGTSTAGLHVGDNGGGSDPTATVITQYNQGDSVQVKAMQIGAWRWGRYGNMWVSAFSGTLLALL